MSASVMILAIVAYAAGVSVVACLQAWAIHRLEAELRAERARSWMLEGQRNHATRRAQVVKFPR